MTPVSRPTGDAVRDYAGQLLAETREELTRADSKAATLFAAVGVAVAVVVGAVAGSDAVILKLDTGWKVTVTLVAVLQSIGLFYLGMALRPKTTKALRGPLHYYGDVDRYMDARGQPDVPALRAAAADVAADPAARDLEQFGVLAAVVVLKYERIKLGLYASGLAVGLLFLVAIGRLIW